MQGQIKVTEFDSKNLGKSRTVTVYLPPGHDPKKTYPVIYCADGLEGVDCKTIEALITSDKIPPIIIVGTAHGGQFRPDEYIPGWGNDPKYFEAHEKFFIEEVMPWAEKEWGASKARKDQAIYGSFELGAIRPPHAESAPR